MRGRRGLLVSIAIVCALVLSACTPSPAHGNAPAPPNDAAAHRRFGIPAVPAPRGMTYQPDVRIVGGGKNAVISGTADGSTWTLDADAPGMSDVKVGDVLWATSTVAGRVLSLTRRGSTAIAVIMPVPITDVIRDGKIKVDTGLTSSNAVTQYRAEDGSIAVTPLPDPSGSGTTTTPAVDVERAPRSSGASGWAGSTPGFNSGQSIGVQGFDVSSSYAPDGVNLSLTKSFKAGDTTGIKLGLDIGVRWDHLRFASSTSISGGKVTDSSTSLSGLKAVTATLTGGAASPAASIPRVRIEVPFTQQIQVDDLPPLVVQFKASFIVGATFGGANATILAHGEWRLDGSAGTQDGKVVEPEFSVVSSILKSISGISLGATGLVFAVSLRALLGIGVPGLAIGPYAKLVIALGVANGSALGSPLTRCYSATLDINIAGGAAFDITSEFPSILTKAGGKYIDRIKGAIGAFAELTQTLVSVTQTLPNNALCRAA